jgi:hypothetical protein
MAHRDPLPRRGQPTPRDQAVEVRMQHQGLAPGVQHRKDARLRPEILGVCQQGAQGVADRLKQQGRHYWDVGQPQRVKLMREGKDDMVVITGKQPRLLEGQPALGLEVGTVRTRPMPTRVVPDTGDVAVGARLDMAAQRGGATLHEGVCGSADVGRERVRLLVGGKRVLEDGSERHEGH